MNSYIYKYKIGKFDAYRTEKYSCRLVEFENRGFGKQKEHVSVDQTELASNSHGPHTSCAAKGEVFPLQS